MGEQVDAGEPLVAINGGERASSSRRLAYELALREPRAAQPVESSATGGPTCGSASATRQHAMERVGVDR
jgi:hypothetical protein